METTREKLVNAIIELAGDEYESGESLIELAKKSEDELIDEIISVSYYYKNELNS